MCNVHLAAAYGALGRCVEARETIARVKTVAKQSKARGAVPSLVCSLCAKPPPLSALIAFLSNPACLNPPREAA
eukprot:85663-Pleurochrysis_carterae.AAC.1